MIVEVILYALIGICAGFFGGLLGIGGGLVTVPALVGIFQWQHISPDHLVQTAIGTSLGAMVFTSATSAWSHIKEQGVLWRLFTQLAPGIILGSLLGALIADYLPSHELKIIFGACVSLIGCYFLVFHPPQHAYIGTPISPLIFVPVGLGIGTLSTILGIGGGLVTVPILVAFGTPLRNSIATSAATGFLIALIGASAFFYLGMKHQGLTASTGYLYLPAFFVIGIVSVLTAPIGAKLTYILPTETLKRIFGLVLICVGIWML